jgi:hypothetical protein
MRVLMLHIGLLLACLGAPPAVQLPAGDAQPTLAAADVEHAPADLHLLAAPLAEAMPAPALFSSLPRPSVRCSDRQLWLEHLRLLC